jgi:hypothetical protein
MSMVPDSLQPRKQRSFVELKAVATPWRTAQPAGPVALGAAAAVMPRYCGKGWSPVAVVFSRAAPVTALKSAQVSHNNLQSLATQ